MQKTYFLMTGSFEGFICVFTSPRLFENIRTILLQAKQKVLNKDPLLAVYSLTELEQNTMMAIEIQYFYHANI